MATQQQHGETAPIVADYPEKPSSSASPDAAVVQGHVVMAVPAAPALPPYFAYAEDGSIVMRLELSKLMYVNLACMFLLVFEFAYFIVRMPSNAENLKKYVILFAIVYASILFAIMLRQMRRVALCAAFDVRVCPSEGVASVTTKTIFASCGIAPPQTRIVQLAAITRVAVEHTRLNHSQAVVVVYCGEHRTVVARKPELVGCDAGPIPAIAQFWLYVARECGAACPEVAFDVVCMPTLV